ncbi:NAD(P)H-dependent flavin oxidoreductase [Cytobacillus kochii]|uniref:NAD(P)H-dependent flavin oxidoreductase n=1 Tax=Cytobacillus kochii TaxID=859143 RepID=UPI00402AAA4A
MKYLTTLLNIQYPIIQGGMGNISSAQLTAAISEAGGLGTIGCGTSSVEEVAEKIKTVKKITTKPFAVNIPLTVTEDVIGMMKLVIKEKVPIVSLSAGNPAPYIAKLHEVGIKVIVVVASVKHAMKAERAGADILVAEGFEAAGINSSLELTTFTLIPQIVKAVNVPVVAAGGIGDGSGLAAAMMLGASGCQMGTRFIATEEAPFHENYKKKIIQGDDLSTMILGRPHGKVRRVITVPYAQTVLAEQENDSVEQYLAKTSETQHVLGAIEGDFENGFINGGQVVGLIDRIPTVKVLIEQMMKDLEAQVSKTHQQLFK